MPGMQTRSLRRSSGDSASASFEQNAGCWLTLRFFRFGHSPCTVSGVAR